MTSADSQTPPASVLTGHVLHAALSAIDRINQLKGDTTLSAITDASIALKIPLQELGNLITPGNPTNPRILIAIVNLTRTLEAVVTVLSDLAEGASSTSSLSETVTHLTSRIQSSLRNLQKELPPTAGLERDTLTSIDLSLNPIQVENAPSAIHTCVQCGQEFKENDNPEGGCKYHPALVFERPSYWKYTLKCCGKDCGSNWTVFPDEGCRRTRHSAEHHDRFPYINRIGYISNEIRDHTEWVSVSQSDADPDGILSVTGTFARLQSGHLAFWITQCGTPVLLNKFDVTEIESATTLKDTAYFPFAEVNESTTLLNDAQNLHVRRLGGRWNVKAGWVVEGGVVVGVRVSATAPASAKENCSLHRFKLAPLQVGKTAKLSDDNVTAEDVAPLEGKTYHVDPPVAKCVQFPKELFEEQKESLPEPQQIGDLGLRVKQLSDVTSNIDSGSSGVDAFTVDLMLINTTPAPGSTTTDPVAATTSAERLAILKMVADKTISVEGAERLLLATSKATTAIMTATPASPLSLIDVQCWLSLDQGVTWIKAGKVVTSWGSVDAGLGGMQVVKVDAKEVVKVRVQGIFEAKGKSRYWHARPYIARLVAHPVLFKVTIEEALGSTVSLTTAYRNPCLSDLPAKDLAKDLFFLGIDDTNDLGRMFVRVIKPDRSSDEPDVLFKIAVCRSSTTTHSITPAKLRSWIRDAVHAHEASETKQGLFSNPLDGLCDSGVHVLGLFDGESGPGTVRIYGMKIRLALQPEEDLTKVQDGYVEDVWVIPRHVLINQN